MPIYTYQCDSCATRFELRQGWDAEAVAPCPACQTQSRRLLVVPSVIFKGQGWYSTDSRRSSHHGLVGGKDSKDGKEGAGGHGDGDGGHSHGPDTHSHGGSNADSGSSGSSASGSSESKAAAPAD